ncbi:MAG TPA: MarR family transcriptional regulator [Myxococcaceae bacterium]|jgi:DNA-binding MarR family transcriptional regulator
MVAGDRVLAPLGVTATQWKVLAALEAQGPSRLADLVSQLRLDQAGTSRLVERLERAGLVTRQPSREDGRVVLAALTQQGRQAAGRCRAVLEPMMRELTSEFDDARLVLFCEVLEAFTARAETFAAQLPRRRLSAAARRR